MAHEIEFVNGVAQMAYAGDVPWHGLGKQVPHDLTPAQILEAAGLDWKVRMVPAFAEINDQKVAVGHSALVRSMDDKVLDVVSNDWNPVQNQEAFDFFNEFVAAGDMEIQAGGPLTHAVGEKRSGEMSAVFRARPLSGVCSSVQPRKP